MVSSSWPLKMVSEISRAQFGSLPHISNSVIPCRMVLRNTNTASYVGSSRKTWNPVQESSMPVNTVGRSFGWSAYVEKKICRFAEEVA